MSARFETLLAAARPPRGAALLLTAISADDDGSLAAWREWRRTNTITGAKGAESRLLAAVGRRLLTLEADPGDVAALAAVKREVWRANQLRLNAHISILRRLADAGLPMMLLKGGGRIAGERGAMETRVIRDIDVLFPSDRLGQAVEALIAMGLRSVNGRLPGMVKSQAFAPVRPAGPRPADYLELDIHSASLRLGQRGSWDEELWHRAEKAELLGVPVWVPSVSDRYIQAIAHGLVADADGPVDWVVDALIALRNERFDPALVDSEIRRRRLGVPLAIGSTIFRDDLGVEVPEIIFEACRRDVASPLFRHEMAGTLMLGRERRLYHRLAVGFVEWVRSSSRRNRVRTWNTAWILRPSLRRPKARWVAFSNGKAEVTLPGARVRQSRLTVFLACEGAAVAANQSFDLLLDGIWIGRLRMRLPALLSAFSCRVWRSDIRYRFPAALTLPEGAILTIVALAENKMPVSIPLEGICATAADRFT